MTILPKKKEGEESDSDSEGSGEASPSPATRPATSGPSRPPDNAGGGSFLPPSSDGYYHRHYEYSSSGESSPELPVLSKHPPIHTPHTSHPSTPSGVPPPSASRERGESEPGSPPYYSGYNSAEEYEATHRPFFDHELERQFEQALKKSRGMVIHKMKPDGACLFRAVADQVYGDQEMHSVVRNHTMDYMLKNADYFSQFVTEDFEQYINRKRSDHSYGNNLEMQAMAEMYNRAIEVHQYSIDPINIFFGVYKTDNAPIRLSYHGGVHYNSVVDPYTATIGVGLGLAGHKPGLADKMLVGGALRESEALHLEQTLLSERLQCSDRDTTYEALEEAVARESYLTWLREQEMRTRSGQHSVESTSAACVSGSCASSHHPLPPPINTLSSSSSSSPPPHPSHRPESSPPHLHTLTPSSHSSPLTPPSTVAATTSAKQQGASGGKMAPNKPHTKTTTTTVATLHTSSSESKLNSIKTTITANSRSGTPQQRNSSSSSSLHGLRNHHHNRWTSPSPSSAAPRRSSSLGGHHGSARTSPYVSPRTSPPGTRRGSPRNSHHGSPYASPYHSPRNSIHGSPSPSTCVSPTTAAGGGGGGGGSVFKYHSPKPTTSSAGIKPPAPGNLAANKNANPSRVMKLKSKNSPSGRAPPSSSSSSPATKSPPTKSHPSPPHTSSSSSSSTSASTQTPTPVFAPDFESGQVLDQLPFEYSSFLDLPPSAFGLSEWENDRVLAAVLAASQQEYLQELRQNSRGGGAESL